MSRISLLVTTLKYMKPSQLLYQIKGRRAPKARIPGLRMVAMKYRPHLFVSELDADPAVVERFFPERILEDEVRILNQSRRVDFSGMKVIDGETTPLWRFNLHYCEYAVALMVKAREENDRRYLEKTVEIFMGAASDFERRGSGRSPYVLSVQAVNLLIAADMMRSMKNGMDPRVQNHLEADLYRKYIFLKKHTEKHLLANHYLENLKALLILAICYGEEKEVRRYLEMLEKELSEQILPDGMHYERSFMYHKLVLEDLLRVVLCAYDTPWEDEVRDVLLPYIRRMCIVTDRIETGIPRTPLFNDGADNVAKPAWNLLRTAARMHLVDSFSDLVAKNAAPDDGYAFSEAGYYKLNRREFSMIVSASKVGPSYNPGHNHNDCLSFELFYGNRPVFVNSGCYSYFGEKRQYARSVSAHNTFLIDGVEHSECWASHRVAKRMEAVQMAMDRDGFVGQFTDYAGRTGQRSIRLEDGAMHVIDSCIDDGEHRITSYLHVGPDFNVEKSGERSFLVCNEQGRRLFWIEVVEGDARLFSKSPEFPYSPEFGVIKAVDVIRMEGPSVQYRVTEEGRH